MRLAARYSVQPEHASDSPINRSTRKEGAADPLKPFEPDSAFTYPVLVQGP